MFARLRRLGRSAGRLLRTLILAPCRRRSPAATGSPSGAAWGPTPGGPAGFGTPDASPGSNNHGNAR